MGEAITTGVFGTLILAMLVYVVARIDRLTDEVHRLDERLTGEVHGVGERVARLEGRLDREGRS